MPVNLNNNSIFQTNFGRLVEAGDDRFVKQSKDGGLKIGYSTLHGELKFSRLSDAPILRQGPRLANGERLPAKSYASPRTAEINKTKQAIARKLSAAAANELEKLLATGSRLDGEQAKALKRDIAEFKTSLSTEIIKKLNRGDDSLSGVDRVTVRDLKESIELATDKSNDKLARMRWGLLTAGGHGKPFPDKG